ncbi:hypothetical protein HMPREF9120_00071 [Neisseria sp. oral taxon 020 str. F0370]|nr:hypothetical protein HMPREF9120_00071 [Neisseria sp. oral taxon 020 str. F0370]
MGWAFSASVAWVMRRVCRPCDARVLCNIRHPLQRPSERFRRPFV